MFFLSNRKTSIFTDILKILKVPHTFNYSKILYDEHPYKDSLYGLSTLLDKYMIQNSGYFVENKEHALSKITFPFIVATGEDMLIVLSPEERDHYQIIWKGKRGIISKKELLYLWNGQVLLFSSTKESIEPDYKKHLKIALFEYLQNIMGFFSILVIVFISFYRLNLTKELIILIFINIAGLYISFLLHQKENNIQNEVADKICSLFKEGDCSVVLKSSASKFLGIINWTEIGISYFISNVLIMIIFPKCISYLAWLNIAILPYSFWSIWYQKFKARIWCPLCLSVQIVLWFIFFINLYFNNLHINEINYVSLILIACIYLSVFSFIRWVNFNYVVRKALTTAKQSFDVVRLQDEVFTSIMQIQPRFKISEDNSNIFLGNPNSNVVITLFSNPHCNPCSYMHKRVVNLLKEVPDIKVQLIFSSFSEDLDISCKFLIAVYMQSESDREIGNIYSEWFMEGRNNKEYFFEKYNKFKINVEVEEEYSRHVLWREINKIQATPKIFFHGYMLPKLYKIEDLRYFTYLKM